MGGCLKLQFGEDQNTKDLQCKVRSLDPTLWVADCMDSFLQLQELHVFLVVSDASTGQATVCSNQFLILRRFL